MKVSETIKKTLSFLLCLCMLVQYVPMMAHAADQDNLCEHHADHNAECGYVEGETECAYHCDVCLGHDHGEEDEILCTCESEDGVEHAPFCDLYQRTYEECKCVMSCAVEGLNEYCETCYFEGVNACTGGKEEQVGYAQEGTYRDIKWKLDDSGHLTISGNGPMDFTSAPWYPLCNQIYSVTIEDGVTSIGQSAFERCVNLSTVYIPASVEYVAQYVFNYCTNLSSVTYLGLSDPEHPERVFFNLNNNQTIAIIVPAGYADNKFCGMPVNKKPSTYVVSVVADPSEGGTVNGGGTYDQGTNVTVTATANEGYNFVNWTENGNVVCTDVTYDFTVEADRTLTAIFEEIPVDPINATFTATGYDCGILTGVTDEMEYSLDGCATWIAIENTTVTISSGLTPSAIYVRYVDDAESAQPIVVGRNVMPSTLYAGIGQINGTNTTMEYAAEDATEWTTCTGASITGLEKGKYKVRTAASGANLASASMTLTVQAQYNITYVTNGGTIHDVYQPETYITGSGAVLPWNVTNGNKTFLGWSESDDEFVKVAMIGAEESGDKTFYAWWQANSYTITYELYGGTINGTYATSYEEGEGVTLPTDVTRDLYNFRGWSESNQTFTKVEEIAAGTTGNKTFYAWWQAASFNITYHSNYGDDETIKRNGISGMQYLDGNVFATPEGKHFVGWAESQNGNVINVVNVNKNIDLYAIWADCADHLTYKEAKAATCIATGNVEYWMCSCGKMYVDEDATDTIVDVETEIDGTAHNQNSIVYDSYAVVITATCNDCENVIGTAAVTAVGKTYDGTPCEATVTATGIFENKAINVTYAVKNGADLDGAPSDAGTYVAYINLEGKIAVTEFTIGKKAIEKPTISNKVYTGTSLRADVTDLKIDGNLIYRVTANRAYVDVGSYESVVCTMINTNYKWEGLDDDTTEITLKFSIIAAENAWIEEPSIEGWTYGDEPNAVEAQPKFGELKVEYKLQSEGDDAYTTKVPTNAGNYDVRVTVTSENNNFSVLTEQLSLVVEPKALSEVTLSANTAIYNGEDQMPTVTVNDGEKVLVQGTDYSVTVVKNGEVVTEIKETGNYTITVIGIGNYKGNVEKAFEVAECDHKDNANVDTKCCTDEFVCSICKEVLRKAKKHTPGKPVHENKVDATCGKAGSYDVVVYCTAEGCEHEMSRTTKTIPATGKHNYRNGKCSVCGQKDPNYKKPGIHHWFDKWWGKCKHHYVEKITEPTCVKGGYTTHKCIKCGDSYKDSYTEAKGHDWDNGKVTKKATCTKNGVKTYSCEDCNKTKTVTIKAIGHKYFNGKCKFCGKKLVHYFWKRK